MTKFSNDVDDDQLRQDRRRGRIKEDNREELTNGEKKVEEFEQHRKCYNCGKRGHMAADCPHQTITHRRQCRVCRQYGHYAADCPNNIDDIAPTNRRRCLNCGKFGHYRRDCPDR